MLLWNIGKKLSVQLSIPWTEYKSRKIQIPHLMNYGMDSHPMSNILTFLEETVTLLRIIEMVNLMLKVKVYS